MKWVVEATDMAKCPMVPAHGIDREESGNSHD